MKSYHTILFFFFFFMWLPLRQMDLGLDEEKNNSQPAKSDHINFSQCTILEDSVVSHLKMNNSNRIYNDHGIVTLVSLKDIWKHSLCLVFEPSSFLFWFTQCWILCHTGLCLVPGTQKHVLPPSICTSKFTAKKTPVPLFMLSISASQLLQGKAF